MSVTKVLFIGNCQSAAIANMLNLNKDFFDVSLVHVHLTFDQDECLRLIQQADIIISQRIVDDVLGNAKTSVVLDNRKKQSRIILYNACYMKLYYFDLNYLIINNIPIEKPCAYHHKYIIDSYKNDISIYDCYSNYINNPNLLNKDQLLEIFSNDIQELSLRYQEILQLNDNSDIIDIIPFIIKEYKKKLLFYSINHPTNILLEHIVKKIIKILNINHYSINNREKLPYPKCILHRSLSNILEFDIQQHQPYIIQNNNQLDTLSIISEYYSIYRNIGIK